ncbi:vWA domain-containing protein [Thalassotalea sp. PLHSN55]|uniref:vWA domain-containing protein n=1 Tax=Thalassotalea sp. PLHSN55 TaxID=3435888 RepID=UPI003F833866
MNFEYPALLWLLLLLPLIAIALFKAPNKNLHQYANTGLFSKLGKSTRQKCLALIPLLYFIAIIATMIALAQPYGTKQSFSQQSQGIAISIVVDISTSMDFDMDMNGERQARIKVAKKALKQFVIGDEKTLNGRHDDLISVITFARYPDTLVPFTNAHQTLVAMTDEMTTTTRPNEDSTAYGDATALAAAQLKHFEKNSGLDENKIASKVIVLLTDGENNSGDYDPLSAAALAKKWGIKIYTISLADESRETRQLSNGEQLTMTNTMDSTDWVLQAMAQSTGGIFQRAYDYQSLHQVYQAIDQLEKSSLQQVNTELRQPYFHIPTFIALVALLLGALLNATWLRRL